MNINMQFGHAPKPYPSFIEGYFKFRQYDVVIFLFSESLCACRDAGVREWHYQSNLDSRWFDFYSNTPLSTRAHRFGTTKLKSLSLRGRRINLLYSLCYMTVYRGKFNTEIVIISISGVFWIRRKYMAYRRGEPNGYRTLASEVMLAVTVSDPVLVALPSGEAAGCRSACSGNFLSAAGTAGDSLYSWDWSPTPRSGTQLRCEVVSTHRFWPPSGSPVQQARPGGRGDRRARRTTGAEGRDEAFPNSWNTTPSC